MIYNKKQKKMEDKVTQVKNTEMQKLKIQLNTMKQNLKNYLKNVFIILKLN